MRKLQREMKRAGLERGYRGKSGGGEEKIKRGDRKDSEKERASDRAGQKCLARPFYFETRGQCRTQNSVPSVTQRLSVLASLTHTRFVPTCVILYVYFQASQNLVGWCYSIFPIFYFLSYVSWAANSMEGPTANVEQCLPTLKITLSKALRSKSI